MVVWFDSYVNTSRKNYSVYRDSKNDPSLVLTQYRYRFNLQIDKKMITTIRQWCNDNCERNFELISIVTSNSDHILVCAFEKKVDCMSVKLRWL